MFHIPVLLKEVMEFLKPKSGEIFFDGTLGGGGYAEAILSASSPDGKLLGVDIDMDAVAATRDKLARFGERVSIERGSYADIALFAHPPLNPLPRQTTGGQASRDGKNVIKGVFDGMVLDLGVSNYQLNEGTRGFSFSKDGPLDMRMDKNSERTAGDVLNNFSERELEEIFKKYGEERFARRIAVKIVEVRNKGLLKTTKDLEEICFVSYPPNLRKGKIHPATKVFQAIRIIVNSELENLKKFLDSAPEVLKNGGRIVIVGYHSLEDRPVKQKFREWQKRGGFKLLTKKPVLPSAEEVEKNPRARSAKLRAVVRG